MDTTNSDLQNAYLAQGVKSAILSGIELPLAYYTFKNQFKPLKPAVIVLPSNIETLNNFIVGSDTPGIFVKDRYSPLVIATNPLDTLRQAKYMTPEIINQVNNVQDLPQSNIKTWTGLKNILTGKVKLKPFLLDSERIKIINEPSIIPELNNLKSYTGDITANAILSNETKRLLNINKNNLITFFKKHPIKASAGVLAGSAGLANLIAAPYFLYKYFNSNSNSN